MAELKTKANDGDVDEFLRSIENQRRRDDSFVVLETMQRITGYQPRMWGESIVGFGAYHYKQRSGQAGKWPMTGFSPRKAALTVYIMPGFKNYPKLMDKLGKYKNSVSCLYVTRLQNIDMAVLEELIATSVEDMRRKYRTDS